MDKGSVMLLTSTTSSNVSEASLTVRMTDFHAMGRRVVLRNFGTIEISELNYELLSWDEATTSLLFEPDIRPIPVIRSTPQVIEHPGSRPTIVDLDEAELRVRLALNQANADSGEQIVIRQSASSVQVTGIVETNVRKQELQNCLRGIPLVSTSLHSIEEMTQRSNGRPPSNSRTQEYSAAYESPLEAYLVQKSATREQVSEASREILEAALAILKESHALNSLNHRFSTTERDGLTSVGRSILAELFARHKKSLASGIAREQSFIDSWVSPRVPQSGTVPVGDVYEELTQEALINKGLCDEVLATSKEAQKSADRILLEMRHSLDHMATLVASLDHTSADTQP
jgi:hypothetical protein